MARRHPPLQNFVKKETKKLLTRITIATFAVGSVAFVIFAVQVFPLLYFLFNDPLNDREFDATLWREQQDSFATDNPRGQMVYHLRESILEPGMSKDQIRLILGEPDYAEEAYVFKYNLGRWTGWQRDFNSLDLHFDEGGHLRRIEITQH